MRSRYFRGAWGAFVLTIASAVTVACSGNASDAPSPSGGTDGGPTPVSPPPAPPPADAAAPPPANDAGQPSPHYDAAVPPTNDAGAPPPAVDGGTTPPPSSDAGPVAPPTRNSSCTPLSKQTGTAVNTTHGRLDGTLVYILPINGSSSCNGDSAHVHLQVEVAGAVYDVAVDIGKSGDEVGWFEKAMALPGGTWAEGWHGTDSLGYKSQSLSSSSFTMLAPSAMGSEVETLLASTSKISVFCTGYTPGDNGCHDVHYQNGTSDDGAIVLNPDSATPTVVFFKFSADTF